MNKKYDFYDSIFDYQFDKAIDELEEKENQTIHGLQTQIACLKKRIANLAVRSQIFKKILQKNTMSK